MRSKPGKSRSKRALVQRRDELREVSAALLAREAVSLAPLPARAAGELADPWVVGEFLRVVRDQPVRSPIRDRVHGPRFRLVWKKSRHIRPQRRSTDAQYPQSARIEIATQMKRATFLFGNNSWQRLTP